MSGSYPGLFSSQPTPAAPEGLYAPSQASPAYAGSLSDYLNPSTDTRPDYAARNAPWTVPGSGPYSTTLDPSSEASFRQWTAANKVPFDPNQKGDSDYDMRGFYQGIQKGDPIAVDGSKIDPNDGRMHYPDKWKTPLHETFSRESQWATPNAPAWNEQDQLVTPHGQVLFDDRRNQAPRQSAVPQSPLNQLLQPQGR